MKRNVVRCVVAYAGAAAVASCNGSGFYAHDDTPVREEPPSRPAPMRDASVRIGAVVTDEGHVPALYGGTLAVLRDGRTAVAGDPDFDTVTVADVPTGSVRRVLALREGDEPGRVVEGDEHRVYVALRRGGAVVTIDVERGEITERRPLCPAPRGLAWDAARAELVVACAGGELVRAPAVGTEGVRTQRFEPDLRDVVVRPSGTYVSWFRKARVARVHDDGTLEDAGPPVPRGGPSSTSGGTPARGAAVGWRTVLASSDALLMLHQVATNSTLGASSSPSVRQSGTSYGATPDGAPPVETAVTAMRLGSEMRPWEVTRALAGVHLGIDVAVGPDGRTMAVVAPGGVAMSVGGGQDLLLDTGVGVQRRMRVAGAAHLGSGGESIAVAFDGNGQVVVQTRSPARLVLPLQSRFIALGDRVRYDTGHRIFHAVTPSSFACASCHPEGGDDGRVWSILGFGPRRTPSLRGGLADTMPFHWDGDMRDFDHLTTEVFGQRMGGGTLTSEHTRALGRWVEGTPAIPQSAPSDPTAVARGAMLFHSPSVACASCHAGPKFTNNQTVDVGTGGRFQVPPLTGLAFRAPYLHNGFARTLEERFLRGGGGDQHGRTGQLSQDEVRDLVAYLATL